jgi:ribosomal protein L19
MNNPIQQFEEFYSQWSILDKIGQRIRLSEMWRRSVAMYKGLVMSYNNKGYLTEAEVNHVQQLQQLLQYLQIQKMDVDQMLINEMTSHLLKIMLKK